MVLEQKAEIEGLHKRDAERQKVISFLETHMRDSEGKGSDFASSSSTHFLLENFFVYLFSSCFPPYRTTCQASFY
jgi:hypothetical protein